MVNTQALMVPKMIKNEKYSWSYAKIMKFTKIKCRQTILKSVGNYFAELKIIIIFIIYSYNTS